MALGERFFGMSIICGQIAKKDFILVFRRNFLAFTCVLEYYGIAYENMLSCKMDIYAKPHWKGEMI